MTKNGCPLINNEKRRSGCPITNTLDLIGDKWTLLIIRDMMYLGKSQFGEFTGGNEGISTNILTDRLKKLEQFGIISKSAYQENPTRYEYNLTPIGDALEPLLIEMMKWGGAHIDNTYTPSPEEVKEYRDQVLSKKKK
jgi:DNA-binding HxlR family transcriptional regulator